MMNLGFCFVEQEADLVRKHSEDETRCADRPQHLSLLQAVNKREFEVRDLSSGTISQEEFVFRLLSNAWPMNSKDSI